MTEQSKPNADTRKSTDSARSSQVIIEYSGKGLEPPVYVAGSFTSWTPVQMKLKQPSTSSTDKDAEVHFVCVFENVPEGEYQYKFRIGEGEWWVTDDRVGARTAVDEHGHKNNVVSVKADDHTPSTILPTTATTSMAPQASRDTRALSSKTDVANNKSQTTSDASLKPAQPSLASDVDDKAHKQIQPSIQPTSPIVPEKEPASATQASMKPSQATSMLKPMDESGTGSLPSSELKTAESPAPRVEEPEKPGSLYQNAAKTAAEVADTAAKLDRTTVTKPSELGNTAVKNDAKKSEIPTEIPPKSSWQDNAAAIAAKALGNQDYTRAISVSRAQESLSSPTVPPAPVVTPVTPSSPPVTPHKLDEPIAEASIPLPPTPATPLRNFDDVAEPPSKASHTVGKQELAPSSPGPPMTPGNKIDSTPALKEKTSIDTPQAAARIPLPPTPAQDPGAREHGARTASLKIDEPEEPVPGDFPSETRRNTMAESPASLFEYITAIPSAIQALFAGIMGTIFEWLSVVFNPQRAGLRAKRSKTD